MISSIWVLDDHRAGTTKQSIALAKELGLKYKIIDVSYNIFAFLPNIFFAHKPFHISNKILKTLDLNNPPKLIISAGRRAASLASYLKRHSNQDTKIVQIMAPRVKDASDIDLVVLPQHDKITKIYPRVIKIIGALCQTNLKHDNETFKRYYPKANDFIGVIIGGSNKYYDFSMEDIYELCAILNKANLYQQLSFFITFSRRTPQKVRDYIKKTFTNPHIIYDFETTYNPYNEILANAKFLVTTADSISICSEIASIGKPLYIYSPKRFTSKKHIFFLGQLLDLNIAKKLDSELDYFMEYYYNPLQEVQKVAQIIKNELL